MAAERTERYSARRLALAAIIRSNNLSISLCTGITARDKSRVCLPGLQLAVVQFFIAYTSPNAGTIADTGGTP